MQPYPSPGDLPNPGIEPGSPALQAVVCIAGRLFTIEHIYSFLGTKGQVSLVAIVLSSTNHEKNEEHS